MRKKRENILTNKVINLTVC